jgi:hypothetical protein
MPIDAIALIRVRLPTIQRGGHRCSSHIENAGRGLFAQEDFQVGDLITYYDGPIIRYRPLLPPDSKRMLGSSSFIALPFWATTLHTIKRNLGLAGCVLNDGRKFTLRMWNLSISILEICTNWIPFERLIAVRHMFHSNRRGNLCELWS